MGGLIDWIAGSVPRRDEYQGQNIGLNQGALQQGMQQTPGRVAPTINTQQSDQVRAMQMQQNAQLQGVASGQQQGAGELAVQRQMQNALAGQQAMARMRGMGGTGQLAAQRNSANIGINGAGLGQQAAMQDQSNANGMLMQALQGTRGADQSLATSQAGMTQNQMQLNDQAYLNYIRELNAMDQNQITNRQTAAASDAHSAHAGGLISTAGTLIGGLMMSDERLKEDISEDGAGVDAMLDALKPYRYKYKDEKFGKGARTGIMAQDLEKSAAGSRVIVETEDGKGLDVNKALSAALASSARLNERVRKLEGKAK